MIDWLRQTARDLNQASIAQLAINYLRSLGWIDGLVTGVENEEQLTANLRLFDTKLLGPADMARIEATRPKIDDWLLDPGKW